MSPRLVAGWAVVALALPVFACGEEGGAGLRTAYAVGVATRQLVDESRPTPANGTAEASPQRVLVTEVWYPADGPSDGAGAPVRDATPAEGPFPLVLFVHGSESLREQSVYLTAALAASGYVVAAADFPLTAWNTAGGPSDWHVEDQVGDLGFLADALDAASRDRSDLFSGLVAAGAPYGVVGHSTGGTVALLAAHGDEHDARVGAIASLSGNACFFDEAFFARRAVPFLTVDATRDLFVPWLINGDRAYRLSTPPKVHATLLGGSHLAFTELDLDDASLAPSPEDAGEEPLARTLAGYGDGSACLPLPEPGTDPPLPFADQHALTVRVVRAFLDDALRGDGRGLDALAAGGDEEDPRLVLAREP